MTGHELVQQVATALERAPRVTLTHRPLHIGLDHGDLVLEGEVQDVAAKKLALERAGAIDGVDRIIDRLHVGGNVHRDDEEILERLCAHLAEEPTLRVYRFIPRRLDYREEPKAEHGEPGFIAASVEDGVVTLDGQVESLRHKRLAGHRAWWIAGVRDVVNGLAVEPSQEDSDDQITLAVQAALEKDPAVSHAKGIEVETHDAVVRLTGVVPTEDDARAAEFDAWCTFAVNSVENELRVQRTR